MPTRTLLGTAVVSCALLGACLLTIPDVVGGDASVPDTGAPDAGRDVASSDVGTLPDVVVPSCDGGCSAPAGFSPVLFALDQATACPSGLTTVNGAADPTLGSACACDCTVTKQPSCVAQNLVHYNDSVMPNVCNSLGTTLWVDGGCQTPPGGGLTIYPHWSIPPLNEVTPGTCTSNPANDPAAATVTASRMCVDPTCASVCTAPPGFKTCFVASGAVACPTGLTPHHVGNVAVSCNACSACLAVLPDGGCQGTMTLYSDVICSKQLAAVAVDGGCDPTADSGNPPQALSYKYTPVDVGTVCTPGTATGTVSLNQEVTVCCP